MSTPCSRSYTVQVFGETWRAGYTEFMYDLDLKQQTTDVTTFEVPVIKKVKIFDNY